MVGVGDARRRRLEVLGLGARGRDVDEEDVRQAFRKAAVRLHPDKGGDPARFAAARLARDALLRELADARRARAHALAAVRARHGRDPGPAPGGAAAGPPAPRELREGEDGAQVVPGADLGGLAEAALAEGDFRRAEECLDTALAYAAVAGPGQSPLAVQGRLRLLRCRARAGLGRWEAALADAGHVCRLQPLLAAAWLAKARCAEALERWQAAKDAVLEAEGRLEGAAAWAEVAAALRPGVLLPAAGLAAWRADVERRLAAAACLCDVADAHGGAPVTLLAFRPPPPAWRRGNTAAPEEGGGDGEGRRQRQLMATVGGDGATRIWAMPAGEAVCALRERARVTHAAWSPDGSATLATGSEDGRARLWAIDLNPAAAAGRPRLAHVLEAHRGPVTHVAFDAYGGVLATSSADGSACVWDADAGALLHVVGPGLHTAGVNQAVFSPNGRTLATASDDETARVWDLMGDVEPAGECLHTLAWGSGKVNRVAYTPCGRFVVLVTHQPNAGKKMYRILLWSAVSGRICRWYDGHQGLITGLAWLPPAAGRTGDAATDGQPAATGSWDGTLRLWTLAAQPQGAGGQDLEIEEFQGPRLPVRGNRGLPASEAMHAGAVLALAADGGPAGGAGGDVALASGHVDGAVRVFAAATTECVADFQAHVGPVEAVAWADCGEYFATAGGEDGRVRVWRRPAGV